MKRKRIVNIADLTVLAIVVLLNPLSPWCPYHPRAKTGIPDKVEIRIRQVLSPDSIQSALNNVDVEIAETDYYLRNHNVTDEGYNLIAQRNTTLQQRRRQLQARLDRGFADTPQPVHARVAAKDRPLVAVKTSAGYWKAGRFHTNDEFIRLSGKALVRDSKGRVVQAVFEADTIVRATRTDSLGTYSGQMDSQMNACGQGTYDALKGCHYEGFYQDDQRHGFGFESSPLHQVRVGEWKKGKFLGEKLHYTAERIYGIDISRHQHEKGRRRYAINWRNLRITSLGRRHQTNGQTFPVSFVYIKSTEGTTIRNRYFVQDYKQARKQGLHVGAYHFFSLKSSAQEQAAYFVSHTLFRAGDFPPVLDVEPSEAQIAHIGGSDQLMQRIRVFMEYVERRTGMRPILYVNQMFVNNHMQNASDIKRRYNVWIARYGQYKPDVKLVYWQLCADGSVRGITGDVDINVFNGYQGQFDEFCRTGFHQ